METIAGSEAKTRPYSSPEREQINNAVALLKERGGDVSRSLKMTGIIHDLGLDAGTVSAALLVDSFEQGRITLEEIENILGKSVASLVEDTARIAGLSAKDKTIQEAENIRKMLFAMVKDIRVIFIKLADRLYTLREAGGMDAGKGKNCAQECLDIYAPLADRLGISWIKDELEDLALKEINREAYMQIKEIVAEKRGERQQFLEKMRDEIGDDARKAGIPVEVSSRAKHFYSIYQKMRKRGKAAEDLYDLFGIRIICGSIEHCYTLLGIVHRRWKPLEGRFKDYIAIPKSNGYQSLHTTVITPEGRQIEIQIRTSEMHHIAENGIASHWLYKKGSTHEIVRPVDISIINRLRDWKETETGEGRNSKVFLEEIKKEILKDSIYVFTPKGKVIELPAGATPIDFAYAIHSAIGDHCSGAKADGVIIPLSSGLENTQVVEILTAQNAHPHQNWLRIAKTSKARSKIRAWFQQNDENSQEKTAGKKKTKAQESGRKNEAAGTEGTAKSAGDVQLVIRNDTPSKNVIKVRIQDEKNMLVKFANCCKPVVGDPITGYISRGRGIIIHRSNCRNLANITDIEERRISAEWENASPGLIQRFIVEARMAPDLFSEIEGAVRKYQGHLIEGRFEENGANHLTGSFVMQLESPEDRDKIMKGIRGIPAVYSIRNPA